jgi:hypothetical protein
VEGYLPTASDNIEQRIAEYLSELPS